MPLKPLVPTGNDKRAEPEAVLKGLDRALRCTCAIENAGSKDGTGVLISRDLVLTNYHVVDRLIASGDLTGAECRFDYRIAEADETLRPGESFNIVDVSIVNSPTSRGDLADGGDEFDDDKLDYAIIRIDRPAGLLKDAEGKVRRWIELPKPANIADPELGMRIIVLQHPYGEDGALQPLKYDHAEFVGTRGVNARFLHAAATQVGSSGSPCFSTSYNFGFIALHNAAYRRNGETFGQAIPLSRIAKHINKYFGSPDRILGNKPPSDVQPNEVVHQRADAIARRKKAAFCLMDRSTEENEFLSRIFVRSSIEQDEHPLLHVLVCKENDAHAYFLERLQHLSFNTKLTDAEQSKLNALKRGLAASTWSVRPGGWPQMKDVDRRKKDLANLLSLLDVNGRHLLMLSRTIDAAWSATAEGYLLREFANMLSDHFKTNPKGIQVVVSFIVSAGVDTDALASEFAGLWAKETPPHCGVCVRLSQIGKDDLIEWRTYLGGAWGENGDFAKAVDDQFQGAILKPLNVVADGLSEALIKYISTVLERTDPFKEE